MSVFGSTLLGLALAFANPTAFSQLPAESSPQRMQEASGGPTAEAIMARVATNQDRAESERVRYVYVQHAHVVSRKGRTVMCEEVTDSRVTPSSSGSHVDLLKLSGRLLTKHDYVTYTTLPRARHDGKSPTESDHDSASISVSSEDTDRDLVEHMRANLTNDESKDGISRHLFPLTSKGQKDYLFHLAGRERMNGRDVFHIDFRPRDKNEFAWKGDAYIDAVAYQPVVVSTAMARKIPFAVRTLLGTNLPGLGFTVVYAPQSDGMWFPVNLGTEFKLHVLFFFHREIIIDAHNREFEKTHVSSKVVGAVNPPKPE